MEKLFEKINNEYKIRFYKGQKQKFRNFITEEFNNIGYNEITVDKAKNIIIGNPHEEAAHA